MDEEEDDVFTNDPSFTGLVGQEDRGTQTLGRPPARPNGMLPCGVSEEPRRLFYGSAAILLLDPTARREILVDALAMEPHRQWLVQSVEARIGRKLQMIGDQFYQDHMLQLRNQRDQRPFWLRLASALYTLLFERELAAGGWRAQRRR